MGTVIRFTQTGVSSDREQIYRQAIHTALTEAYGSKLLAISFAQGTLVEDPENLYQIGINQIDDLFVTTIDDKADAPEATTILYNGSNLKTVTVLKFAVPRAGEEPFEQRFADTFKRTSLQNYPNPNIYPKSDARYFANLLYVFSQAQEKAQTDQITCDNAESVLAYYPKALKLFEIGKELAFAKVVGRQEEAHTLTTRMQDAQDKSGLIERCRADASKSFELVYNFGKIDQASHEFIRKAATDADLENLLKQYTSKPVEFRFDVDGSNLNLQVSLRFDRERYLAWTKNRVPHRLRGQQILSLDPYFALMQKLVVFRSSLSSNAPAVLQSSFPKMRLTLALTTLMSGQALFGVDGKYDPKTKSIAMAYPNSAVLQIPGFDSKTIVGRNDEIFQEKTWMALGNCKTVDGTTTEDGLLINFFGLSCS